MADADEVARMIADLGLARRDLVSAPNADSRGRAVRDDLQAQRRARDEFEARERTVREEAPADNERAARLRAWYTGDSIERDEVSEGLENRFSGQGHRAALTQFLHGNQGYDQQAESMEARVGEERRIHVQEYGQRPSYVATARPGGPPGRRFGDSTPRTFPGGHVDRGRVPSGNAHNPNRPRSPRSFGVTRFVNGQAVTANGTATRPSAPAGAPTGPRQANRISQPARPAPTMNTAPRPSPVMNAGPRSNGVGNPSYTSKGRAAGIPNSQPRENGRLTPPPLSPVFTTTSTSTVNSNSSTQPVKRNPNADHTADQVAEYDKQAKYWVLHPGPECDAHYRAFPDREFYLRAPLRDLVKTAFKVSDHPLEASKWSGQSEQHKSIYDQALRAKLFVKDEAFEEAEAYYQKHESERRYYNGAKVFFHAKVPAAAAAAAAPAAAMLPSPQPAAAVATVERPMRQPVKTPTQQPVKTPTQQPAETPVVLRSENRAPVRTLASKIMPGSWEAADEPVASPERGLQTHAATVPAAASSAQASPTPSTPRRVTFAEDPVASSHAATVPAAKEPVASSGREMQTHAAPVITSRSDLAEELARMCGDRGYAMPALVRAMEAFTRALPQTTAPFTPFSVDSEGLFYDSGSEEAAAASVLRWKQVPARVAGEDGVYEE